MHHHFHLRYQHSHGYAGNEKSFNDNSENDLFFVTLLLFDGDEIEPFLKKLRISAIELKFGMKLFCVYFHTTKNGIDNEQKHEFN